MPRKVMLSTSNRPQLIIETSHGDDDDDVESTMKFVMMFMVMLTRIRKVNTYIHDDQIFKNSNGEDCANSDTDVKQYHL